MKKSVSIELTKWKLNSLKSAGIDIEPLMSKIDITHYELENPGYRLPAEKHFALIKETKLYTNRTLSKDISLDNFYTLFPVLFGLCLNSKNMLECVNNFLTNRYLMGNCDTILCSKTDSKIIIEYKSDRPDIDQSNSAEGNFLLLCSLLMKYDENIIVNANFDRNPVISRSALNDFFNTNCEYNSNSNTLIITSKRIETPYFNCNHSLYNLQKNEIKKLTLHKNGDNFSSIVKTLIEKSLLSQNNYIGNSVLDDICETLKLSRWTINKKLQQENTTYTELLKNSRLVIACNLLANTNKTVQEISEITLFSSPANLTRFFNLHMNCSPLKFRNKNRNTLCDLRQ